MNIFIEVAGSISCGLDSPTRGEGRWCLNIARCLANDGHRVVMSSDGGMCYWGDCVKHPNIDIIQWRDLRLLDNSLFDVFFTVNITPGSKWPVHAKIALSGAYSLGGLILEPEVSRVQDNVYTLASTRDCYNVYSETLNKKNISWKDRYKLLCQPYGKHFGTNKFHNRTIIFSPKEIFHPRLKIHYEVGRKIIYAAIDACKVTGAAFVAISSDWNGHLFKDTVESLGIFDKIKEIPNHKILPILPYNRLMNILDHGSVIMPLGFAGCIPDALFNGLVPLLCGNIMLARHPDIDIIKLTEEMGDSVTMSQDEVRDVLIKLLTDEAFYNYFQRKLQVIMEDNLDENVLKQFYDIIEHDESRTK